MVQHRRCVFGCGNYISLFPFPPKESKPWLRQKWMEFTHFDEGGIFNNSRLCDRHFKDDCFNNKGQFTLGLATVLSLSENSIPSVYTVGESPEEKCKTTRNIGCQTDPPRNKSVGTQFKKTYYFKSQATQTRLRPESVGFGTPVHCISTYPESFQPSKKRRLTLDDDDDDDDDDDADDGGDSIEVTEPDSSYIPAQSVCTEITVKAVALGDALSPTNDPENSAAAITENTGSSDSLDERCSKLDEGEHNLVSSDEGQNVDVNDHKYSNIADPLVNHNIHDGDGGDHNSDSDWDPPENHSSNSESDTDEKHESPEAFLKLCAECGRFFYSKAHTCKEKKKPYSCNVCGKRYLNELSLKVHSKIHKEGYNYKHVCRYCSAAFRTNLIKLSHEQSHPPAEKPYQCPDCPEVFAKMRERSDHLLTHRGPKRHICVICNMEFTKNYRLQCHLDVHRKVKKFVCEVCQRSFTQSTHLKSHMRVHTGEKPYQCQHCDKSFNHNVSRKSHIQRYHGQVSDPGMKVLIEKTCRNESETEKNEANEMESIAVDAEPSKDTLCNTQNGGADEEEKKEDKRTKKSKYDRPTGRPIGRPKKNAVITLEENVCIRDENEKDQGNSQDANLCIRDENEKDQGYIDSTDEEPESEHDSDPSFEPGKQQSGNHIIKARSTPTRPVSQKCSDSEAVSRD